MSSIRTVAHPKSAMLKVRKLLNLFDLVLSPPYVDECAEFLSHGHALV
jgi:hypothetical protein